MFGFVGNVIQECPTVMLDKVRGLQAHDVAIAHGELQHHRGWYNSLDDETLVNDEEFSAGTAFLCNFAPSKEVQLTFAGQVLTGDVTIDSEIKGIVYGHPYVVNPFPVDITLGDIEMKTVDPATGMVQNGGGWNDNCSLMIIDPSTSQVDMSKIFLYWGDVEGASNDDRGWYNSLDDETIVNETPVKAGEGFLCNFATSLKPKLVFKNPVKK